MNVPSHAELIEEIDAFQARHPDIKDARFGREATGEPGLVARLRRGSSPTLSLLERISAYVERKDSEKNAADHAALDTAAGAAPSSGKTDEVSAAVIA